MSAATYFLSTRTFIFHISFSFVFPLIINAHMLLELSAGINVVDVLVTSFSRLLVFQREPHAHM